jgi:hypothetical protein
LLTATAVRIAMAVAIVSGAVLVPADHAVAARAWRIQSSPNAPAAPNAHLNSVACPMSTKCFAVGSSISGAGEASLVEQRTTGTWSVVTTAPGPQLATYSILTAVACADSTHCVAVGNQITASRSGEFSQHWDGTRWTIHDFAVPASRLAGVACPSASLCFAVGLRYTQGGIVPVIARWNGSSWTNVASPAAPDFSALTGVGCSSGSKCFAVGTGGVGGQPLIERWNGSTWSIVASPAAANSSGLSAVTCASATECFAVGDESDAPLAERWDGTSWSIVASDGTSPLADVACSTATTCFAVGGSQSALIEGWNGSAFVTVNGAPPGESLGGITCPRRSRRPLRCARPWR